MDTSAVITTTLSSPTWVITALAIVAVTSFIKAKREESSEQKQAVKIQHYAVILEKLSTMVQMESSAEIQAGTIEQAKIEFVASLQALNLIASEEVIDAANSYVDCMQPYYKDAQQAREAGYTALISAMREDIYDDEDNDDVEKSISLLPIR